MAATGTAADAGNVKDALGTVNASLGKKAETVKINGVSKTVAAKVVDLGTVVTSVKSSDGTALAVTAGVVTLPAAAAPVAIDATDLAALITN